MGGRVFRLQIVQCRCTVLLQQHLCRTMNSKECVSRGCSLQAAMLSPIFQVRHFDVKDLYPFKVNISWEKDGTSTTSQLFGTVVKDGNASAQFLPCVKNVAFMKTEPFSIQATYSDDSNIGGVWNQTCSLAVKLRHMKSCKQVDKTPPAAVTVHYQTVSDIVFYMVLSCLSVCSGLERHCELQHRRTPQGSRWCNKSVMQGVL